MIKQVLAAVVAIIALVLLLWAMLGRSIAPSEAGVNPKVQGGGVTLDISSEAPPSSVFGHVERTLVRPTVEALPEFGRLFLRCPGFEELPTSGSWVYERRNSEGVAERVSFSGEKSSVALNPGVWLLVEEPDLFRSSPVVYVAPGETAIALARIFQSYTFTVHDDNGTPIEGALLEWEAGPMVRREQISRMTNNYGTAVIDLPASLGNLKISHPKYWTESITLREGVGGNFPIVLSSISKEVWEVQFVEEEGDEPISGLRVDVVGSPSQGGHSDGRGFFTFSHRDEEGAILKIKGENHVALEISVDRPRTTLRLPQSSQLNVQVFDGSGNPVEGARVQVRCSESRDYSGPNGGNFMPIGGVTDLLGSLVLGVSGEIPLDVEVSAEGYFSYLGKTSISTEVAIHSVQLNDSEPLSLTLLDPQGLPVEDARILGRSLDGVMLAAAQEGHGVYSFSSSAGLVSIRIEKQGYVGIIGGRRRGKIMNEVGLGGRLVLRLSKGYEVQGRVLWDTGTPAANVEISLFESMLSEKDTTVIQAEGNAVGWRWTATPAQSHAFTDSNGEFDFFGIETGDWEVNWKTPDGRLSVIALKYASFDFKSISVPTTGPVTVVLPEPVFVVISAVNQQTGNPVSSFDIESSHPDYVPMLNSESPVQAGLLRGWFQHRDLQYLTVVAPGYFSFPLVAAPLHQVKEKELHYSVPLIPAQAVGFQVDLPENYDEEGVAITIQAYPISVNGIALMGEKLRRTYQISNSNGILNFDCPIENEDVRVRIDISSPKGDLQVLNPEVWVGSNDFVTIEVGLIPK